MKKTLVVAFIGCLLSLAVQAQHNWCVSHNGKTRLRKVSEQPEQNQVTLTNSDLMKNGYLQIKFSWVDTSVYRTILVDDASGSGLRNGEEVKRSWRISNPELSKLFEGRDQLKFYYTEIPQDVNKAMLIRIRPVHLCTVNRKKS
jgi:hypothetical protein